MNLPLQISVNDFFKSKAAENIGTFSQNLNWLMEHQGQTLTLQDKKTKKRGTIKFAELQIIRQPTFVDYLRSGIQLNLITAIDFTASNGDPMNPQSLHYIQEGRFNQYEACICAVGSIICPYDTDQLFPVFGFGGGIGPQRQVSHCFPLTFDPNNPNVHGLEGILGAYRQSLRQVQLSGPTLFAPILGAAIGVAMHSFAESKTYTILMILTDGCINDMQPTIDAVVAASDAPLSVVVVGVGNADFSAMKRLDADDVALKASDGRYMKRDILQFVPFNRYSGNGGALAGEVLAEIPKQVDEFCRTHGFRPAGF
jgi:hypothetical protein